MVPVADALTKTHENSSLRSSGNSESEDVVVNEGCTSSSKGYTPCHFILSLCCFLHFIVIVYVVYIIYHDWLFFSKRGICDIFLYFFFQRMRSRTFLSFQKLLLATRHWMEKRFLLHSIPSF